MSVLVEIEKAVLHIHLERPERKNALDVAAILTMVDALEQAATDDSLRVVWVSAAGDNFCSGADWVASNRQAVARPRTGAIQRRLPLQAHRLIEQLTAIQLPVVSAVRGWAAGLGFQMALAADFTIAAEDACFWEPFLERGFSPDSGSTWLLPRMVGLARAKEILLLGRKLSGREAADWGLILKSVPHHALDASARDLVDALSAAPTVAVGLAKRCLHSAATGGLSEAMEAEATALELTSRTADFKEGLAAFNERRAPEFEGR